MDIKRWKKLDLSPWTFHKWGKLHFYYACMNNYFMKFVRQGSMRSYITSIDNGRKRNVF